MKPWENHGGTGQGWEVTRGHLSSWGQLGPCTDVLSSVFSPMAEQCLESIPLEGSVRFSVTFSTQGASEPPPHPSAFPTCVPPFYFSFLPGAAVVLLGGTLL